ncbi:UDP-N-acetylmuramoyl-tripeptide--D-alanyl-D-alanine ligase [Iodobacter sp. HSC-16F04]|uniref:UDP-N-acetylmuramoyl-tripeptide--D-alanyl-D-alanine ligase n=1 Tax=Iodobacter violaceini TaxID=3044271 RepID=A0ABX0L0D2_9NEIS|nr:UDP-N-acetylmuramoyl-tripeptide--D-alanyl-D-alanine ligase [Iodobacter violacea]NHQ87942.1 UDP-N-acetylmuramoyl-tripeptide--D-alanyl-D-alanine ligase [Iodobacter violacea]
MLSLQETAQALKASFTGAGEARFARVTTDSRDIRAGDLFIALRGEKFNANEFADAAIAAGAVAAIVDTPIAGPHILVSDTLAALGQLAACWRELLKNTAGQIVIGVTGSNGKTTVKEMISAVLTQHQGQDSVHATRGNLNNHIGLPLTLLAARAQHRYVVAEMGMNHFDEISYLTHIAKPDIAIITNAGRCHLEALGSVAGVAQAKGEIFAGLVAGGYAIINNDDDYAPLWRELAKEHPQVSFSLSNADVYARNLCAHIHGAQFTLCTPDDSAQVDLQIPGLHNVLNALGAAAVGHALKIGAEDIASGLASYEGTKGRLQSKNAFNGAKVFDDTYNANPDSMKAAIDVLAGFGPETLLVLGDMGEIGSDTAERHQEIGAYARSKGIRALYTLGEQMQLASTAFGGTAQHFADVATLIAAVRTDLTPTATLLVKGSRFMRMERVVDGVVMNTLEKM